METPPDNTKSKTLLLAATALFVSAALSPRSDAVIIGFSGGFPGTQHLQSDGVTPIPTDGSFQFQLGTFGGFTPTTANTDEWLDNWVPVSDAAGNELDDATTDFTVVTFGAFGSFDGFSGSVDLDHNNAPFTAGQKAYIWGFDTRDKPGNAEWILMTRLTSDATPAWTYPAVANAISPTFSVGTADTVYAGSINGQQMTLGQISIPAPVPEPGTAGLAAIALGAFCARRRRTTAA